MTLFATAELVKCPSISPIFGFPKTPFLKKAIPHEQDQAAATADATATDAATTDAATADAATADATAADATAADAATADATTADAATADALPPQSAFAHRASPES